MGQHRAEAGEDVLMDSDFVEDKQSNLEANDEFLTKENLEEHNGEDAGGQKSRAKSTAAICKSSRERWAMFLDRRHLL